MRLRDGCFFASTRLLVVAVSPARAGKLHAMHASNESSCKMMLTSEQLNDWASGLLSCTIKTLGVKLAPQSPALL
jgi:hypothetical protein